MQHRKKKVNLVTDQVSGWANRVVSKLNSQILGTGMDQFPNQGRKLSILQLFSTISDIVGTQIEDIIQNQNDGEDEASGFISGKDFMNDFATEEFLTKNIRVRPQSSATGKDQDDKQSEHVSRANLFENGDDEEKFNKMINLEMEDQRKKIKVQKEEIERKKAIMKEKNEKAKDKLKK